MIAVDLPGGFSSDWFTILFAAVGGVLSVLGYRLSKRGQDVSHKEERFASEFAALKLVNDTLREENARQFRDLTETRILLEKREAEAEVYRRREREEWEPRWARQMERCRRVTDSMAQHIAHLAQGASSGKRKEAAGVLGDLRRHREIEHLRLQDDDETAIIPRITPPLGDDEDGPLGP